MIEELANILLLRGLMLLNLKRFFVQITICCFIFFNANSQNTKFIKVSDSTQHLKHTEFITWHSAVTNRDYLLYISYPPSYNQNRNHSYPIVFLTDAYWSFNLMATIGPTLWQDKLVPEYILIGIGYADKNINCDTERFFELTPNKENSDWANNQSFKMGGSALFLKALKEELFPYTDQNFRTDVKNRILVGASLGGLFGLYSLYHEPNLFKGFIMASPWILWDGNWALNNFNINTSNYSSKTRWYLAVAEYDSKNLIKGINKLDSIASQHKNMNLEYKFNYVKGLGHSSSCIEVFSKGLCFIFKNSN